MRTARDWSTYCLLIFWHKFRPSAPWTSCCDRFLYCRRLRDEAPTFLLCLSCRRFTSRRGLSSVQFLYWTLSLHLKWSLLKLKKHPIARVRSPFWLNTNFNLFAPLTAPWGTVVKVNRETLFLLLRRRLTSSVILGVGGKCCLTGSTDIQE